MPPYDSESNYPSVKPFFKSQLFYLGVVLVLLIIIGTAAAVFYKKENNRIIFREAPAQEPPPEIKKLIDNTIRGTIYEINAKTVTVKNETESATYNFTDKSTVFFTGNGKIENKKISELKKGNAISLTHDDLGNVLTITILSNND